MKKLLTIALLLPSLLFAQDAKKYLRDGNSSYKDGKMDKAGESYLRALEVAPENEKAIFNMGDALYRQEKYAEAAQQFEMATNKISDDTERAAAWHNYGNSMLQAEDYGKSVEAYKNALKANPSDEDTRYNLAYANQKLQEQQQQQQQDEENKDEENEEKDENQDGDKDKEQQDKENENKENEENKDQEGDQQKDQEKDQDPKEQPADPQRLSKEEAERMLNALNNQEKDVQDKVKKKKMKVGVVKVDKDW